MLLSEIGSKMRPLSQAHDRTHDRLMDRFVALHAVKLADRMSGGNHQRIGQIAVMIDHAAARRAPHKSQPFACHRADRLGIAERGGGNVPFIETENHTAGFRRMLQKQLIDRHIQVG